MKAENSHRPRVAYLGPPSSYTHQAAVDSFSDKSHVFESQISISDVFSAVQSASASIGVVPFENSSNGPVSYTLDCLIDREEDFPDVTICGEVYMSVQHCLLGHLPPNSHPRKDQLSPCSSGNATPTTTVPNPRKPHSQPSTDVQHVTDIYSHPQAFGQCEEFLSTYLKGVERHEVTSTSKAAEMVAESPSKTAAAISSRLAAEVHSLDLIAQSIQDREDNTTRFFVLRKNNDIGYQSPHEVDSETTTWKGLIAFSVNHGTQGALAEALLVYRGNGLNVTSINSRPSRVRPWHYIFLVEFQCSGTSTKFISRVNSALATLRKIAEGHKFLGHWQEKSV